MLTVAKLAVYARFGGDLDGWARQGGPRPDAMVDADWYLVDELISGLRLAEAGRATPGYVARLEDRLLAETADEAARTALRQLALGAPAAADPGPDRGDRE